MKALAYFGLIACAACSGIQFGDDDESGSGPGPCTYREEAIADATLVPDGFSAAPARALAPADESYDGTLTLPSGEAVALGVTLALDPGSVRAVYWDSAPGGAGCAPPALKAALDLTIDGGDTLSGVVDCEVQGQEGALSLSTLFSMEPNVTTTLVPSFARPALHPPSVIADMDYRDGAWRGQWYWMAFTDCTGVTMCSGIEETLLGTVELSPSGGP